MRVAEFRPVVLAALLFLSSCGGDDGGIAFMPTPPPTPPPSPTPTPTPAPPPAIIPAATTSQQFTAVGSAFPIDGDHTPRLGADEQLQVRYVASSNSYEVQIPHSQNWVASTYSSSPTPSLVVYQGGVGGASLWVRTGSYQYSSLFEWSDGDNWGYEAIGMATLAGGVPITGSASYAGQILGRTSEYQPQYADDFPVDGTISLSFNFGLGSLSGSITPNLHQGFNLGAIAFRDTVYSTGSTNFSGKFDTNLPGINSFSGLFTGPSAQELIGNFAFPYQSPIDSKTYQADGAFVGKK